MSQSQTLVFLENLTKKQHCPLLPHSQSCFFLLSHDAQGHVANCVVVYYFLHGGRSGWSGGTTRHQADMDGQQR